MPQHRIAVQQCPEHQGLRRDQGFSGSQDKVSRGYGEFGDCDWIL